MGTIKKWFWVVVRLSVLLPIAAVIVLSEWCDEAFPHVEKFLDELEGK